MKPYKVTVTLRDGRSFVDEWDAAWFNTEEEFVGAIDYQYTEGNGSCDCNKSRWLGEDPPRPCGDSPELETVKILIVTPEGKEVALS